MRSVYTIELIVKILSNGVSLIQLWCKALGNGSTSSISSSANMSKGGNECLCVASYFDTFNILDLSRGTKNIVHFSKTQLPLDLKLNGSTGLNGHKA